MPSHERACRRMPLASYLQFRMAVWAFTARGGCVLSSVRRYDIKFPAEPLPYCLGQIILRAWRSAGRWCRQQDGAGEIAAAGEGLPGHDDSAGSVGVLLRVSNGFHFFSGIFLRCELEIHVHEHKCERKIMISKKNSSKKKITCFFVVGLLFFPSLKRLYIFSTEYFSDVNSKSTNACKTKIMISKKNSSPPSTKKSPVSLLLGCCCCFVF